MIITYNPIYNWIRAQPKVLQPPRHAPTPYNSFSGFGVDWSSCQEWHAWIIWKGPSKLHPGRLTWNIIMEVWKIIFLSNWVICRFYVNLPGCWWSFQEDSPTRRWTRKTIQLSNTSIAFELELPGAEKSEQGPKYKRSKNPKRYVLRLRDFPYHPKTSGWDWNPKNPTRS